MDTNAYLTNEADRQLAAIVESSDDAIISKDLEGIVRSWNKGAERIFGYTAEEMVGRSIRILIPKEREEEEEVILGSIREGRHIRHYESIRLRKGGQPIHISLTISPLHDDQGRVIGASKIARDITESKRLEAALAEANRQKDQFLASLAHELRNPLTPLRNGLDLLADAPEKAERERILGMMLRQVEHMMRLLGDLMDLDRINRGAVELRMGSVALQEVVNMAVEACAPLLQEKKQQVQVNFSPAMPRVQGDQARLVQVVGNLVNNASKYTPEGGRIDVRLNASGTEACIHVQDNGIGFEPGTIASAFEMFARVRPADHTSPIEGFGIGLHVVRKLVHMHGGQVEGRSPGIGEGSEFIVRLPRSFAVHSLEQPTPSASRNKSITSKRVLIADDNEDVAYTMSAILRRQGHTVSLARNGLEAIEQVKRQRPDMLIMDIGMPELDGYEACRRIRESPEGRHLRIVALSGWGQKEDRQHSLEAGFDDHLVKPITPAQLHGLMDM